MRFSAKKIYSHVVPIIAHQFLSALRQCEQKRHSLNSKVTHLRTSIRANLRKKTAMESQSMRHRAFHTLHQMTGSGGLIGSEIEIIRAPFGAIRSQT
jgi:hypothetical protein